MKTKKIIFICRDNAFQSQIAASYAKTMHLPGVDIFSAGLAPAKAIHPLTPKILAKFDVAHSAQAPKSVQAQSEHGFLLAVTFCDIRSNDSGLISGIPIIINWNLKDPALLKFEGTEERSDAYEAQARQIVRLVKDLFQRGYYEAIAAQKQNMDQVLESLSEGVIAHDLNRRIFFFSHGAEKLTGLSQTQVIGRYCQEVFQPNLCGKHCSFCDGPAITDFTENQYQTTFQGEDGLSKECDVTVVPLRDESGTIKGVVASFRDQTHVKQLERRLGKERGFSGIIGQDHKMQQVYQQIRDVAFYDSPVHIYGETGTGKELVARAIHDESRRKDAPFVSINCGALPEGLIESELFGHVKGSFSGAVRDKKGRFELAHKGTIFLDEIADLPKNVQVKLLRFLQEGILEKVGSEKTIQVDVRVVSATNKELKQEVQKENFREDLYYRLNVIPIRLPLLRERKRDIPLLIDYFLRQTAELYEQPVKGISEAALRIMMDYQWPGNVRELQNVIQFAIVKCKNMRIEVDDLPLELTDLKNLAKKRGPSKKLDLASVVEALKTSGGNKAKAAKILGVGRATLYRFMKEHPQYSFPEGIE